MSTLTTDLWGEADGPSRRGLLVDVATGAAFAVVVGLVQTQMGAWTWLAAVLLGAALAVRRVAPFVMVALAVAASVVQVVRGNVAWVACLACVPLLVTLGGHRDVRVRRLGLACAAVAVVVAAGWEWARLADERSLRAHVLGAMALAASTAVVVFGSWVAGYLRWQRRQAVQARADATVGEAGSGAGATIACGNQLDQRLGGAGGCYLSVAANAAQHNRPVRGRSEYQTQPTRRPVNPTRTGATGVWSGFRFCCGRGPDSRVVHLGAPLPGVPS